MGQPRTSELATPLHPDSSPPGYPDLAGLARGGPSAIRSTEPPPLPGLPPSSWHASRPPCIFRFRHPHVILLVVGNFLGLALCVLLTLRDMGNKECSPDQTAVKCMLVWCWLTMPFRTLVRGLWVNTNYPTSPTYLVFTGTCYTVIMILHHIFFQRISKFLIGIYRQQGREYATSMLVALFNPLPVTGLPDNSKTTERIQRAGTVVCGRGGDTESGQLVPADPEALSGRVDFFVVAAPVVDVNEDGVVLALSDQQALTVISDAFEAVHHRRPTFWIVTAAAALARSSSGETKASGAGGREGADPGGAVPLVTLKQILQSLPTMAANCNQAVVLVRADLFRQPLPLLMLFTAMAVHWKPEHIEPLVTDSYLSIWSTPLENDIVNFDLRPALDASAVRPVLEPHATAGAMLKTLIANRGGSHAFSEDIACFLAVIKHRQMLCSLGGVNFTRYLEMMVAEGMLNPGTLQIEGRLAARTPSEIPRSMVELKEIVGSGHFGVVHRAIYKPASQAQLVVGFEVAVKTLKHAAQGELEAFLTEATVTVQFDHCNVLCVRPRTRAYRQPTAPAL